ncbi:glucosamine-6-phosphate deaminase [Serinicoccus sp. CUA-874]|uniref:glucosamine-6-phosphate deaminase n=1 Tax=Serinicoccus sp. CUA-874 TaxID=1517939 RepID=UPI000967AA33|nr:glucosamine-6-phosphate deaminase [Serinicoccus sp. CUA-874]OLT16311.1 glucosamine-6-phosphate deaminase [Serinicoccus sp. CUA-874]
MEVVICRAEEEIGRLGADVVSRLVRTRPEAVLGVATGSSPRPVYAELVARVRAGELDLSGVSTVSLDEYVGLPEGHPASYRTEIRRELTDPAGIPPERVHSPQGSADDLPAAARAYEQRIAAAGGVDVQLLGIGSDGHIAFNEPGSSLASRTRIKTLTRRTREDNARFFDGDADAVPTHCLTQGLATIMQARHVVLVATGEGKARAVAQLVEGAVSARWPGTVLQWHPHVSVLLDEAAAAGLGLARYYREAWANKPDWQGL